MAIEIFRWDNMFVTGLDAVDEQHQRLVALVNRLSSSLVAGEMKDDASLDVVLQQLMDYARYHFAEEECLMDKVGVDPRHIAHHTKIHRNFVEQVTSMWNSRHVMKMPAGVLLEFLIAWLSFHILGDDQSLARQIKRIRSGAMPAQALEAENPPHDRSTILLLRALRTLYRLLSERNHDLAAANQHLEERVAQRTCELENAYRQLEVASRTDGLLGIANRMYFNERIDIEWRCAQRNNSELALLLIDVDFFKRYNDTYGHLSGDNCLRAVAQAVAAAVYRPADLIARYGGEEIVVLLPNTDLLGGLVVAADIFARLAALRIPHASSDVADHVTVSIGAAAIWPRAGNNPEQLIAAADAALYEAKRHGRNTVWPGSLTSAHDDAPRRHQGGTHENFPAPPGSRSWAKTDSVY